MKYFGKTRKGIPWLGFELRLPILRTRIYWKEFLQGMIIANATGLALVPLLTSSFGLTFEEAVAISFIQSVLINSSWMVFGEPYAPGWITPALPLVISFVISSTFPTPVERFQVMVALSIDLVIILAFFGITGWGAFIIRRIPNVLKGSIIFGAAVSAFINVFDVSAPGNRLMAQPITIITAIAFSLIFTFSEPLKKLAESHTWVKRMMSMGLLPGFVGGALVGALTGELQFDIQYGWIWLPFEEAFRKASPLHIGWPEATLYLNALPLAIITYILVFGDLITGEEVLKEGSESRKDENLIVNHTRSHLSLAIRNGLMAIAAPFFPTQGILWTGIHVIIVERWKGGKQNLNSLFDGISSFYATGIPITFFFLPLITTLQPLMPMALTITLVLTGFACAYIGLGKARSNADKGAILLNGVCIALLDPWVGFVVSIVVVTLLTNITLAPDQGD